MYVEAETMDKTRINNSIIEKKKTNWLYMFYNLINALLLSVGSIFGIFVLIKFWRPIISVIKFLFNLIKRCSPKIWTNFFNKANFAVNSQIMLLKFLNKTH